MIEKNLGHIVEFRDYIAASSEIKDKNEFILSHCNDREVLDLGCIDHSYETALDLGDKWLHKQICDRSRSTIGLDILEEDAKILSEKYGYNIVAGNAESFSLDTKFDCIVAGDLIEHLSNIGQFLETVKLHMHENSIFIVSTPNPFNIEQIWQAIFNDAVVVNKQHTVWIDPITIHQLMTRHKFTVIDFCWVDTRFRNYIWNTNWRHIVNRITKYAIRKVPLLRRDFTIVLKL